MKAAALKGSRSMEIIDLPDDPPPAGHVKLRVAYCGICGSDLHEYESANPVRALGFMQPVMGHEFSGRIVATGDGVTGVRVGQAAVGNPGAGCASCRYCASGRENLCREARFTGYHMDGGYAEYVVADARYAFKLPEAYSDTDAAPLLCAGLIGYRSYRMVGDGKRVGIYGFGAAAHIVAQVAVHEGREVYAFTSPGDVTV